MSAATAEVLALPGVKLVPHQRLPCQERMRLLEALARQALDLEPEFVSALVAVFAHDSLAGPQLAAAWDEVLERVAIADAAERGCFDWRQIDDALTCTDRTEAATEMARQDAIDALAYLAGGR